MRDFTLTGRRGLERVELRLAVDEELDVVGGQDGGAVGALDEADELVVAGGFGRREGLLVDLGMVRADPGERRRRGGGWPAPSA